MDFVRTPGRERRHGPGLASSSEPGAAANNTAAAARSAAAWVSDLTPLSSSAPPYCPCSLLPLSGQAGQVLGGVDSAICAGARDAEVGRLGQAPPVDMAPAPPPLVTHHPHQLSCVGCSTCLAYFGILCLNNSFRLLHFKFSPLKEILFCGGAGWSPVEKIVLTCCLGCRDLQSRWCTAGFSLPVVLLALQAQVSNVHTFW